MAPVTHPVAPSQLSVTLFGAFCLTVAGEAAPAPRARAAGWILALLILRRGKEVDRHWLAETLWPDVETAAALFNLRRNLSELRKMLGVEAHRVQSPMPHTLRFDLSGGDCDLMEFEELAARKDTPSLQKAVSLYQGELLEGCREEWLLPERMICEHAYLNALEDLARNERQCAHLPEAAQWLRRLIAREPLNEDAHRWLLETLGQIKDFAGVERQYRELRRHLREELHQDPTPETVALYQSLRTQAHFPVSSPSRISSLSSPAVAAFVNLPGPLTSLIGRAEEKRQIRAFLPTARILTIVGAGGVGKTRLALAVCKAETNNYPAGVCFADLSAAKTVSDVPEAVAAAFDLHPNAGVTVKEALSHFLQPRHLLLLLDNAEHVATACASLVSDLLQTCPHLTILCTSRQPLYIAGEIVLPITPLAVPDEPPPHVDAATYVGILTQCESVALLLDRVLSAAPAFRLTAFNAPCIIFICRCLDGLPLALELVAARFRSLSPQDISAHLETKFRLLNSGDPTLPRHRTLHATLDWSYDLLSEAEQRLLRYLAVFRGGWTLEAAEAISLMKWENTVAVLTALVDKSLVVYETSAGQNRYRLLEMTRQYVVERLAVQEQADLQKRHAEFFYMMAQSEDARAELPYLPGWSLALWQERDNFRAAHAWYQRHDVDNALWLEFFLYAARVWSSENDREWAEKLLSEPLLPTLLGLRITLCVGTWALWKGHYACEPLLQNLLMSARLCGKNAYEMYALDILSILEEERGNFQGSLEYTEQSIAAAPEDTPVNFTASLAGKAARQLARTGKTDLALERMQSQLGLGRQTHNWQLIYPALCNIGGILFEQCDYVGAQNAWKECISLAERFCPPCLPNLWRQLGWSAQAQKDYGEAERCLHQALSASQENKSLAWEGWTHWDMAELAFRKKDWEGTQIHLYACFSLFEANNEPRSIMQCLAKLAKYCVGWEQYHRAAVLLGSAAQAFEEYHFARSPKEKIAYDELATEICRKIGGEAWESKQVRGRQMTLAQSVAFATTQEFRSNRDADMERNPGL